MTQRVSEDPTHRMSEVIATGPQGREAGVGLNGSGPASPATGVKSVAPRRPAALDPVPSGPGLDAPAIADLEGSLRERLSGLFWMVGGSTVVLATVIGMNALSEAPVRERVERTVAMELKRPDKPKPKPSLAQPKPRPRRAPKAPPPPSLAALSGGLAGLEFDLPALEFAFEGEGAAQLLSTGEEVVHTADSVDQKPRPVERPPMPYPKRLQDKGIEGYVVVSLLIGPSGQIEQVKINESKPAGEFDQVALEGIRRWRFSPASYRGEPVRVWIRQKLRFELARR